MKRYSALAFLLFCLFTLGANAQNRWIEDPEMHFKIQVPSNYQVNQFWEGSDRIHAFLSPDQNVAVRVRSFKVNDNTNKNQVLQLFQQNIIKGAAQLVNQEYTLNGMAGGLAGFRWKYNNISVVVAAFYTIQYGTAYIVWSLIPENLFAKRNAESDAITNTFTVTQNQQQTAQETNKATQSQIPATTNNTLSNPTTRTLPVDTPINRTPLESRPNALVITNVQLGTGINNSLTIIPENKVIDPAQKTIHMVASHNGKDNGQNFIVRWYSITQQCLVAENVYNHKTRGLNKVHSTIENVMGNWPVGEYKAEIWHMGRKVSETSFKVGSAQSSNTQSASASGSAKSSANTIQQKTSQSSNTQQPAGIKKIVLDNKTYGYDFSSGKLRTNYEPEPDVMNRPWCTPLPALTGNWVRTGKSRMEDVISAPSSGYLSDGKDFIDCAEAPLNEVLLFKLANGKYAKLMIISDEQSKTSSGCEHKITCLVQYPAF